MTYCYIGLGSNLSTPHEQLNAAVDSLKALPNLTELVCSSFYHSKPMGPQDQPDYVNAVAGFNWQGQALELLDALQAIEQNQGRVRKDQRWGPRTLDLDILLFGEQQINSERLIVPHYGMKKREFVLYPLHEIAPSLQLPTGETLADLVANCPINGLVKHAN